MDQDNLSPIERMRLKGIEEAKQALLDKQRILQQHYQLVRLSPLRYGVIRLLSWATLREAVNDIATFELVTRPLSYDDAMAELKLRRGVE